jgi:hypothetical protein
MRVGGTALLLVLGTIGACGFSGEGTAGLVGGAGAPDASAGRATDGGNADGQPGDASLEGGPGAEGGADAPLDASGCVAVPLDAFSTASWDRLDSASVNGAGHAVLTLKDQGSNAGAIWWKAPISFGRSLRVVVDYTFDLSSDDEGDGLTMAWIPTTKPYEIGPQGQSYGICNAGLGGVAAAVDTRDDQLVIVNEIRDCQTSCP